MPGEQSGSQLPVWVYSRQYWWLSGRDRTRYGASSLLHQMHCSGPLALQHTTIHCHTRCKDKGNLGKALEGTASEVLVEQSLVPKIATEDCRSFVQNQFFEERKTPKQSCVTFLSYLTKSIRVVVTEDRAGLLAWRAAK